MTVKELIDELSEFDDDQIVVVASDPEGNSFFHEGIELCAAWWDGEDVVHDDDLPDEYTDDISEVAVIWP